MTAKPSYWADGRTAHPADAVASWPEHNRARMTQPLYDQAALDAAVAAARHAWEQPPCQQCGAMTDEEAATKCLGAAAGDDCHGNHLWPER